MAGWCVSLDISVKLSDVVLFLLTVDKKTFRTLRVTPMVYLEEHGYMSSPSSPYTFKLELLQCSTTCLVPPEFKVPPSAGRSPPAALKTSHPGGGGVRLFSSKDIAL